MKSITFGPVTHPDKSYAYALGYGAYHMGHTVGDNPYGPDFPRNESDWDKGYVQSIKDTDKALQEFMQEHSV